MVGAVGIDPRYFLDDMSIEAIGLALEGYNEKARVRWEQTRVIAFYMSASKSYKAFTTVSFPLPGDKKYKGNTVKPDTEITKRYAEILNKIDGKEIKV